MFIENQGMLNENQGKLWKRKSLFTTILNAFFLLHPMHFTTQSKDRYNHKYLGNTTVCRQFS